MFKKRVLYIIIVTNLGHGTPESYNWVDAAGGEHAVGGVWLETVDN